VSEIACPARACSRGLVERECCHAVGQDRCPYTRGKVDLCVPQEVVLFSTEKERALVSRWGRSPGEGRKSFFLGVSYSIAVASSCGRVPVVQKAALESSTSRRKWRPGDKVQEVHGPYNVTIRRTESDGVWPRVGAVSWRVAKKWQLRRFKTHASYG
jgi:hypothetical protein